MRRRILWAAVIVAVVTLGIGLGTAVVVQRALRERAQTELLRQAEATARFVSAELGNLAGSDGSLRDVPNARVRIRAILRQAEVLGGHDVVEAAVQLPGGRTVPLVAEPRLLPVLPQENVGRAVVRVDVDGVPMLAAVRRMPLPSKGSLVVAIGRSEPLLPVRLMTRGLLFALGVGAVLIVGFGVWFAGMLRRRLGALEAASERIAGGDLSARAPVEGDDEIAEVAEAFNEMAARLEQARRRERSFLMSVGHDLRTPLTIIRGYAEALDSGDVSDEDLARVATVLHTQTDRLSRLVEDVMLVARLEAREFSLRPEPVDLTAHVEEIVAGYRRRTDEARVELQADLRATGVVEIDPDRLAQILTNLLDNALRYTPERGTVRVGLSRSEEGEVTLQVADSGPGIEPEDLPHVFERLYVAGRYRPIRPEGSGLGLAIVKELVDAMGGRVTVDSEPGRGTTIVVTLPTGAGATRR